MKTCTATATVVLATLMLAPSALATVPGPNGLVAFRADTGSGYQLYTIAPDGTGQRQLTNLPGDVASVHWSPQSNRIIFEFDPANPVNNDFCNVAYTNRNGGGLRILPLANGDQCEATPTFSADGHRIFYEGFDGVSRDAIFSMNLNGTDRNLVTDCQGQGRNRSRCIPGRNDAVLHVLLARRLLRGSVRFACRRQRPAAADAILLPGGRQVRLVAR